MTDGGIGMSDPALEFLFGNDDGLALALRDRAGHAGPFVEQRHLAEDVAGLQ